MHISEAVINTNGGISHIYLAGQMVPSGTYRQIDGSREVRVEQEDVLPATCDGRVAAYPRLPGTWGVRQEQGIGECGKAPDDIGRSAPSL